MVNFHGFLIKDYFFTGKIPSEERIGDAMLNADCLEVSAIGLCVQLPEIVQSTLVEAARILGLHAYDPPLPVSAEGFSERAKRAGLL